MNGELHQMLLITALGNGYLISGEEGCSKELEHTDNLEVRFMEGEGGRSRTWPEWLVHLRNEGCQRLMLSSEASAASAWQSSAYIGSGTQAGVTTLATSGESLWIPDWKVDQSRSQTRWKVTYTEHKNAAGHKGQREFIPLNELSAMLQVLLQQIGQLAEEIGETFWKESFFDPAIAILEGTASAPQLSFNLPSVYSDKARRLLNAVYKTWVFGGMGSWNDSPPYSAHLQGREQEYDKYSAELYGALQQCARGVVNSVVLL